MASLFAEELLAAGVTGEVLDANVVLHHVLLHQQELLIEAHAKPNQN